VKPEVLANASMGLLQTLFVNLFEHQVMVLKMALLCCHPMMVPMHLFDLFRVIDAMVDATAI
jgi:hypothetical protein